MAERWWRITGPNFVAALRVEDGLVAEAAPILKWTCSHKWTDIRAVLRARGCHGEPLESPPPSTEAP